MSGDEQILWHGVFMAVLKQGGNVLGAEVAANQAVAAFRKAMEIR